MLRMRRGAFTLIELLAVVGIIIVVLALSLPNFSSMVRSQRWAAASGALQNALLRCQTYAVNDRRDHAIELCLTTDNNTQYLRIEVESATLESIPEMNDYLHNTCQSDYFRLPLDWVGIFRAGGGVQSGSNYYSDGTAVSFSYTGPRYDVSVYGVQDNLRLDDHIYLPSSIKIDFSASANVMNYDPPPHSTSDTPQYGWDYTPDIRFNMAGVLVQAKNPEIVLVNNAGEHLRLQILRSTARVRKLAGLSGSE